MKAGEDSPAGGEQNDAAILRLRCERPPSQYVDDEISAGAEQRIERGRRGAPREEKRRDAVECAARRRQQRERIHRLRAEEALIADLDDHALVEIVACALEGFPALSVAAHVDQLRLAGSLRQPRVAHIPRAKGTVA